MRAKNHFKHRDYIKMFMSNICTVKFIEAGASQEVPVFVVYVKTLLVQTVQCKMIT